ncbi:hypothetical protein M3Y96_00954000 [Aphelenchoides besseyi]|nr:hypothetical protein M3Y96_00954000 [Aphelenchoides besseyi]
MRSILLLVAALFVVVVPSLQNVTVSVEPLPHRSTTFPPTNLNVTHLPLSSNVTVHPTIHNVTGPPISHTITPPSNATTLAVN